MDQKLLILLGLGTIAYLATSSSNDDDDCSSDDMYEQQQQYDYFNEPQPQPQPQYQPQYQQPSCGGGSYLQYYNNEQFEQPQQDTSPLYFGNMVQENYIPSDYETIGTYNDNNSGIPIPVYDEKSGNTLPIGDMTDMAAGEDNKYIYDRTIGSIGFTSTKIGGRRRGQADYIRGDLPILPDRGSWFQVSADVTNTLLDGALNVSNGIGNNPEPAPATTSAPSSGSSGRMQALSFDKKRDCPDDLPPIEFEKCMRDELYEKRDQGQAQDITIQKLKAAFTTGLQI